MNHSEGFAVPQANRLNADQPSANSRHVNSGNVIIFPIGATSQHKEAVMPEYGDDAGQRRIGLSTQNYRGASAEDRAVYRKWILGLVVFYSALLLFSGAVAIVIDASPGLMRLTSLSARPIVASPGSN
jgi:hypothetical protein